MGSSARAPVARVGKWIYDDRMEHHELPQQSSEAKRAVLRADLMHRADEAEHDPHFDFIDLDTLTDQDLALYDLLLRGELTEAALNEYENEHSGSSPSSKEEFIAYLRNKLLSSGAGKRLHRGIK